MADENASAASGQGGADGGAAGNTAAAANWIDSISDNDLKGWAQNKGFKEPSDALMSYRNLEKLMGADKAGRTVTLPAKWDDPAEVGAFYEKLGVPKDPTGYKMPEGADPEMAKWAPSVFKEAGLTPRQAETLTAKWNEMVSGRSEAMKAQFEAKAAEELTAIKTEWGAAYNDKVAKAKAAAKEFGVDATVADKLESALGTGGLLKFFAGLGEKVGEAGFVDGKGAKSFDGALTPDAAKSEIKALQSDNEFIKRYVAGDAEAKQRMERLHKWAYGDTPIGG
jgi:hypothetical protein